MTPESGRKPGRKPRVADESILQLFKNADAPVLTASALAEELPIGHRALLNRLNTLWDRGTLDRMDVAPRGRVWWLPGHTSTAPATVSESGPDPDPVDVEERRETPGDPEDELRRLSNELGEPITVGETVYESGDSHPLDASETPGEPPLDAEDRTTDPADHDAPDGEQDVESVRVSESTPDDVEAALDALDLDDDRREAVRAMYEYLRDAGTARKSDFTGEVYPAHPAGFGSAGGWWNALGKAALGELPNVRKPPEGRPMWQFDGEER